MKLGSLFDGSGGFPLAGSMCGIEPTFASEVEPYPIAVTTSRFPKVKHVGDVTKINGAELEPVHVITFGSTCQDLSVAGKQAGLKHEDNGDEETTRSGLFMEAIRIIKEMRGATNGVYPRIAVWENVPGAYSSNKGEDFRVVLEEIVKVNEPTAEMPPMSQGGWAYADVIMGDGWSIAYRTYDAQYWGVPQRRRRIYLVADFRGECASEILFKREGLRGYFEKGRTPWQGASTDAEKGTGADDREETCFGFPLGFRPENVRCYEETATTLCNGTRAGFCNGIVQEIVLDDQDGQKISVRTDGKSPTLRAETHGNLPCVVYDGAGITSPINASYPRFGDPCHTLHNDSRNYVVEKVEEEPQYIVRRLTPTECARLQGFPDKWGHPDKKTELTDEEYKFWFDVRKTDAEINGKQVKEWTKPQILAWYNKIHTDSSEYKMWGNGIALPNALYVMQGIAEVLRRDNNGVCKETRKRLSRLRVLQDTAVHVSDAR